MTITERRAPRISVQRLGAPDLVAGHLGTGALVKDDIVLLPPEVGLALLEPDAPLFEILIGPAVVDSDAVLERRQVLSLKAAGLADTDQHYDRSDVVLVTLDRPSVYPPVAARGEDERLRTAAREGQDVWTAMELADGIPLGFRIAPDQEWLRTAEEVLGERRPIVQKRLSLTGGPTASGPFCRLFCWFCDC